MLRTAGAALLAIALLGATDGAAETGSKDVQVAAKVFGFTDPPLTGTVRVAIVFAPDVEASRRDADALAGILGTGLAAGKATLVPVPVPLDPVGTGLDGALDGAGAVFVTAGLAAHHEAIFGAAKARGLLSISTDMDCVRAARCVMGIRSEPRVEIVVNRSAAQASSIAFAPAFRMMISEL
ncbi:MAG TPA: hypothetical protein VK943_13325 [Arenibaculum sp.]|nr:hypothetical protein [Arenibaculum sp.]